MKTSNRRESLFWEQLNSHELKKTGQDRTEVYKSHSLLENTNKRVIAQYFFKQEKMQEELTSYYRAVNKQKTVHKSHGSAVDLCATGCCQQQQCVKTKAMRLTRLEQLEGVWWG